MDNHNQIKKLITSLLVFLAIEVLLNLVGLDDLADTGEWLLIDKRTICSTFTKAT